MLTVDKYKHGILIHALNDMWTELIEGEHPTDAVDEQLLKTIDAPKKKRGKGEDETR